MSYDGISYDGHDWMIGWNPDEGEILVGPYPDETGWSENFLTTTGCCFPRVHQMYDNEIAECLWGDALYMISDGVPPETIFREFAKIRIWRDMHIKLTSGQYKAFRYQLGYQHLNPHH